MLRRPRCGGAALLLAAASASAGLRRSWRSSALASRTAVLRRSLAARALGAAPLLGPGAAASVRAFSSVAAATAGPGARGAIRVVTTEDSPEKAQKIVEAAVQLEAATARVEEVKSYYWWEGRVQFDPEWRVEVATSSAFGAARARIEGAHSYDLPMIIYGLDEEQPRQKHWRGLLKCRDEAAAAEVARRLVERREVACAQAAADGGLMVKTVSECKGLVVATAASGGVTGDVEWSPISGNEGYLEWLEKECLAANAPAADAAASAE